MLLVVAVVGLLGASTGWRAAGPTARGSAIVANAAPRERCVVLGATGYIGRAVVKEAVARGYHTTAVVRSKATAPKRYFEGASVVEANVNDRSSLVAPEGPLSPGSVDVVVCCLASRSGSPREADRIDRRATTACVEAAAEAGARHFVLLSAICVRSAERGEPNALAFQHAKLAAERALQAETRLSHTIVRPTAFFKSLSNQFENIAAGKSLIVFDLGGGRCIRANPISEPDLARAMLDSCADTAAHAEGGVRGRTWELGGDCEPLSKIDQGNMMAAAVGLPPPRIMRVPIAVLDGACTFFGALAAAARSTPFANALEDAAEAARIVRYYASEDMVTTEAHDRYGSDTLEEYYASIARHGREYDPYVQIFDSQKKVETYARTAGAAAAKRMRPSEKRRSASAGTRKSSIMASSQAPEAPWTDVDA